MADPSPDRLTGLSQVERFVAVVAERLLGATAEAWDTQGRQGAVDIRLTYPDHRTGALEVMLATLSARMELESRLAAVGHLWPAEPWVQWSWTAQLDSASDIKPLQQRIHQIIAACEAAGVTDPSGMWRLSMANADLRWLMNETSVRLFGSPGLPSRGTIQVYPSGSGGAVDDSHAGLNDWLTQLFTDEQSHVQKVLRDPADEKHLCFIIDSARAPFAIADAICRSPETPSEPPPMPAGLTHLWLIGREYGARVLLWGPQGCGWIDALRTCPTADLDRQTSGANWQEVGRSRKQKCL